MKNTLHSTATQLKLTNLTMSSTCLGRQTTKQKLMKNKNEMNNSLCSKHQNSQLYFALVITLLLTFFTGENATAQCTNFVGTAFVTKNVSCNGGNDGAATATQSGGTSPYYNYAWSNGGNTPTVNNLIAGCYTVTISDTNKCTVVVSGGICVTQPAAFTIMSDTTSANCSANDGTATIQVTGGTQPYSYSWSNGSTSKTATNLAPGSYTVTIIDAKGCSASVSPKISRNNCNVWPGDADYNGVANNNDILAIGVGYNATGPVRAGATINWVAQTAIDWGTTLSNGKDYKNVDCNGDGTINAADTTAIIKNYGLTHALKLTQPVYVNGLPDLTFNFPTDTTLSSSSIKVPVLLGSSTNTATNVYGLAFSITYDPKIVDTTKLSFKLNNSWLGVNGANLIHITKNMGKMGQMDIGITRIDHKNISGFGQIGELSIYMRDDISGKITSTIYKTLHLEAVQIKAISKDESTVQVNAGKDSVVVGQGTTTGLQQQSISTNVVVFPNPTSNSFTIDLNNSDVKEMKLTNILGETVWQQNNNNASKIIVDTQAIAAGTYYLSIVTSQERIVKQVNIMK